MPAELNVLNNSTGDGIVANTVDANGRGVVGTGPWVGVYGLSSSGGIGVGAWNPGGYSMVANGNVAIYGGLTVDGSISVLPGKPKSAIVRLHNGSHRTLYCLESPECWFEDFGRARLVRGRARVRLDRTFAAVIRTGDYHVFLSPEGLSHGLYVSRRTRDGFEVREQHRGTSTVGFSYRIVGRRKDVEAPRFKRAVLAVPPKLVPPKVRARPKRAAP